MEIAWIMEKLTPSEHAKHDIAGYRVLPAPDPPIPRLPDSPDCAVPV